MHPAHVPLEGESKAAVLGLSCDLGPCCGFLGNCQESGVCAVDHRVEVFEELDRVEVLVAAVLVCNPLSILLAVIQIQHGGNSVNS